MRPKRTYYKNWVFALLICGLTGRVRADEAQWLVSLPQAMEQAKNENKLILLDFTGSDWCGWCKKLDAETFSKSEFLDYARNNLMLVQVDFPAHKPQPTDLKIANKALQAKYDVHGFPTVMVFKPDGTVLWKKVGYLAGGPAAMIAKLNELKSAPALPGDAPPVEAPSAPVAPVRPAVASAPPVPAKHEEDSEPKLQGIFYSSTHPCALFNGHDYAEGDSVGGMHVIKIEPDKVIVEWKGKTNELRMN